MKNICVRNVITILFLFIFKFTYTQIVYDNKLEFEIKFINTPTIVSFKEKGFLVYTNRNENAEPFIIEKYDADLKKVKEIELDIKSGSKLYHKFENNDDLHLLFIIPYGNFVYYKINASTLEVQTYEGKISITTLIQSIASVGNYTYLALEKSRGIELLKIDLRSGEMTNIEIQIDDIKDKKFHITRMLIADGSKDIIVFIDSYKFSDFTFYILPIKEAKNIGSIIKIEYEFAEDTHIIPLTAASLGNDEYILTGYYTVDYTNPQGIFLCKTYNTQTIFFKPYKLREFKEFSANYKPPIINGSNKNGEDNVRYNIKIAQNPIIQSGDQFVFYGDFFEQVLEANNSMKPGEPTAYLVGHSYEQSLIAGFDQNGNLLWDKSYPLSGFLSKNIVSSITVFNPSNPLQLLVPGYGVHNKITINSLTGITQEEPIYGMGNYLYHDDKNYYFSGFSEHLSNKQGIFFIAKGHLE